MVSLAGGRIEQIGTRLGTRGSDGLVQIRRLDQRYKGTRRDPIFVEAFHKPSLLTLNPQKKPARCELFHPLTNEERDLRGCRGPQGRLRQRTDSKALALSVLGS